MAREAQQKKRTHIADYILIIAALCVLFSFPFEDFFWGGLLSHLSAAALIGGLADWYAVTALFHKPLGISFKTELIPKSKERIAETARHMIESEILTVSNMYSVLKNHPVLEASLTYLQSKEGFHSAERVLGQILNTFLYTVDLRSIVEAFSRYGEGAIERIHIAPMMGKAMKTGLAGESGAAFLDFSILSLEKMVKSKTMHSYIADIYTESLRQYERRNFVYALVVKAALASDVFRPVNVAAGIQRKILEALERAKEPDTLERERAIQFIWAQADRLEHNEIWQERVEAYKIRFYKHIISRPDMKEAWQRYVLDEERQSRVCYSAASYAIEKLEAWRTSPDQVDQLNRYILAIAAKELKRLQEWFGTTAEQEILRYDSYELAKQLESNVWYDLQMIRINGSLVGGALGTAIFFAMYALKGGW
jgi:Predicted membrane protein